jgi:hypothetical protein
MKSKLHSDGNSLRKISRRLAAATLFAGCAMLAFGCGQYQAGTPTVPGSPAIAVSFCQNSQAGCAPNGSFQVSGTRTMNVVIEWQNLTVGAHSQKVTFVLPSGDEYQAFEQSFEVPDGASGSVTTTQSLQVAGTWIAQRQLTGMWQVNFFLDGAPMGTQSVQLTE